MHSMQKVVSRIIRAMGTPLSYKASKLLDKGDFKGLVELDARPGDYATANLYKLDAQVVATFRKLDELPTGIDLEKKAVDSFFASEERCRKTNLRWARYANWFERGFHGDEVDLKLYDHLVNVRKLIADVLGKIPEDLTPCFSGGSTYSDRGDEITIPHKMSSRPTVTSQAWTVVKDLWGPTSWARACDLSPELTFGNRFTTVPKDSVKRRGICIEPSLCVTYQLPIGSHIADRLRIIGINIRGSSQAVTAQELHKKLALQASIDGLTATLDLSNASDTIAYFVVKCLLPKGWFDLLSALRSPSTYIKNKWVKLQKFSSMGNGFTFELETLLFWALTKSVCEGDVFTYGDDILCPAVDSGCVRSLLTLAGFEINTKKSFWDPLDPFRESCGGDYFSGVDVRPIYLKVMPSNPQEWIVLANLVTEIKEKTKGLSNDSYLDSAWRVCVNEVARNYRVFGPKWAGDMVIHSEDRSRWSTRPCKIRWDRRLIGPPPPPHMDVGQDAGYMELKVLKTVMRKVKLDGFTPHVQMASALLQVPSTGPVPRDGISGYKTTWRATVM